MGIFDGVRRGAAKLLLGGEVGKLRRAQEVWLDAYRSGPGITSPAVLQQQLREIDSQMLDLILQQHGWERIGQRPTILSLTEGDRLRAVETARYMTHFDTQSRNAVDTWTDFGFGQRVEVAVRDNEKATTIWDEFWSAQRNSPILKQRRIHWMSNEAILGGELFFVLWTNKITGTKWPSTTLRRIGTEEVTDIKAIPEDPDIPLWYVQRVSGYEQEGKPYSEIWYPDWQATDDQLELVPLTPGAVDARELRAGTGCMLIHAILYPVNGRGWPQFLQAYQWFRAYTDTLGDVMAKNRAVAMFVDKLKVQGGSRTVDAIAARLTSSLGTSTGWPESNPNPVPGSTWIENEALERSRMPLSTGAGDDRISTALVLGQGYAGTGIPVGLVRSDMFQNRSVADIVMEPWYETMARYQNWWSDVLTDICHGVLMAAKVADPLDVVVDVSLESPVQATVGDLMQVITAATSASTAGVLHPEIAQAVIRKTVALSLARLGLRDAMALADPAPEDEPEPIEPEPGEPGAGDEEEPAAGPEEPEEEELSASAALRLALKRLDNGSTDAADVVLMALGELQDDELAEPGTDASGNWGHVGRPGKRGGSAPRKGATVSLPSLAPAASTSGPTGDNPNLRFKLQDAYDFAHLRVAREIEDSWKPSGPPGKGDSDRMDIARAAAWADAGKTLTLRDTGGKLLAITNFQMRGSSLYVAWFAALKGNGARNMRQLARIAADDNLPLELSALPGAVPFYEKMGFERIGGGTFLPHMRMRAETVQALAATFIETAGIENDYDFPTEAELIALEPEDGCYCAVEDEWEGAREDGLYPKDGSFEQAEPGTDASGNFGHAGRPGKRGGSAPRTGAAPAPAAAAPVDNPLLKFSTRDANDVEHEELAKEIDRDWQPKGAPTAADEERMGIARFAALSEDGQVMTLRDERGRLLGIANFRRREFDMGQTIQYEIGWMAALKGNGARMMRALARLAAAENGLMDLDSVPGAVRFYKKMGFDKLYGGRELPHMLMRRDRVKALAETVMEAAAIDNDYIVPSDEELLALEPEDGCYCVIPAEWKGMREGGEGSGFFGHAGRPGQVGGSVPDDVGDITFKSDPAYIADLRKDMLARIAKYQKRGDIPPANLYVLAYERRTPSDSPIYAMAKYMEERSSREGMLTAITTLTDWNTNPSTCVSEWQAAQAQENGGTLPADVKAEIAKIEGGGWSNGELLTETSRKAYDARREFTRAYLRATVGDTVTLYRGVCKAQARAIFKKLPSGMMDREAPGTKIDLGVHALSSWATLAGSAYQFAYGGRRGMRQSGVVLKMTVPIDRVILSDLLMPGRVISFRDDIGEMVLANGDGAFHAEVDSLWRN